MAVRSSGNHPTIAFAAEEWERFARGVDVNLSLRVDDTLRHGAFACDAADDTLTVRGSDPAAVLAGVYTALEHAGILFDIAGPVQPDRLNAAALRNLHTLVRPAVTRRGIRQHINFPMDISAYTLQDALEYIRNLARLRFNHITFHSYPRQWYPVEINGEPAFAGRFFYNQPHAVPDHPLLRKHIANKTWFCIPEIEPLFDDDAARSTAAIDWLRAVIAEAKRVGMTVQFSLELRTDSPSDAETLCRDVLALYPAIDTLEIITQECGGSWGPSPITRAELAALIDTHFGPNASDDPDVAASLTDGMGQLILQTRELATAIATARRLLAAGNIPQLALGIYTSDHATLRVLLALLRRHAPSQVTWAFLPAHAARAAAESLRAMAPTPADLARTTLYSWIEFDGTMFIQQNGLTGIRQIIAHAAATLGDHPIPALAFNHWRTAENRLCARYAAEACLFGPLDETAFYHRWCGSIGVAHPARFAEAMALLDDVDTQARNQLPNVGFCYEGCWRGEGLGPTKRWKTPVLQDVISKYQQVRDGIAACLSASTAEPARDYLAFLINRIECSILHLRAIERLSELQAFYHPETMTDAHRAWGRRLCDEALSWAEACMTHHAQAMPDRGCQGTLISYHVTVPVTIRRLRTLFGPDVAATAPALPQAVETAAAADAPPPPAIA